MSRFRAPFAISILSSVLCVSTALAQSYGTQDQVLTIGGAEFQNMVLTEAGVFDFATSDAEKWRIFRLVDPNGMGEEISALFQSRGMAGGATAL